MQLLDRRFQSRQRFDVVTLCLRNVAPILVTVHDTNAVEESGWIWLSFEPRIILEIPVATDLTDATATKLHNLNRDNQLGDTVQ